MGLKASTEDLNFTFLHFKNKKTGVMADKQKCNPLYLLEMFLLMALLLELVSFIYMCLLRNGNYVLLL